MIDVFIKDYMKNRYDHTPLQLNAKKKDMI